MKRILAAVALLVVASSAFADFTGRVVKVSDGDTLTVLVNKTQVRVRLDAIDAPESKQAFGKRSRQSLAEMCAGKDARVAERGRDGYGRNHWSRYLRCGGSKQRSGAARLRMGVVKYAPKDSPLYALESEARAAKRGLWSDSGAVAPWEWRRSTVGRLTDRQRLVNEASSP